MIREVTIKNFRCFGAEEQRARLAPLTLLVGENSTGKTSFLAIIRALCDVAFRNRVPDFKEPPYDLGSFDEIAHFRGGGRRAESFEAGFTVDSITSSEIKTISHPFRFEVRFERDGSAAAPTRRKLSQGEIWLEETRGEDGSELRSELGEGRPTSQAAVPHFVEWEFSERELPSLGFLALVGFRENRNDSDFNTSQGNERELRTATSDFELCSVEAYAGAPVRSRPRRTYDPSRSISDPEGEGSAMYLSSLHARDPFEWHTLKHAVESFGRDAGLFDEISVRRWGKGESATFQIQIWKGGQRLKGPPRNLIDVGYGVSQALPVVTEILRGAFSLPISVRDERPRVFLLQQPEVHLHPKGQAALGSFFCQHASPGQQLVVETHSDYLLDRVRLDVRDRRVNVDDRRPPLKPEDVSILFFERRGLDVRIHSITLDEQGQVANPPPSYREFFMEEINKRLKL